MNNLCRFAPVVLCLLLVPLTVRAEPPALHAATGTVEKVEKDVLTVRPRGAGGKFEKSVGLKLTGTSKVTTLVPRMQAGKLVLTQVDTTAKDLKAGQSLALIYADTPGGPVLLAAVVQPAAEKPAK